MEGKIVKGIAGFYYVYVKGLGLFECKAKGIFRNQKIKPLVGDNVLLDIISEEQRTGNIVRINNRRNQLIRPAVSNIDQAMVIFAAAEPEPNMNLLDRFLISMKKQGVPTVICFNKMEEVSGCLLERWKETYAKCGYEVLFTSALLHQGLREIKERLLGKTTVLAGPSGVGKSSITNWLYPEAEMETGEISRKLARGKHTTRHTELFYVGEDTYLFDTPGFSSLFIEDMEKEELKLYFGEFDDYEGQCKFQSCVHICEPGCAVKKALSEGRISAERYENYVLLFEELKHKNKYGK